MSICLSKQIRIVYTVHSCFVYFSFHFLSIFTIFHPLFLSRQSRITGYLHALFIACAILGVCWFLSDTEGSKCWSMLAHSNSASVESSFFLFFLSFFCLLLLPSATVAFFHTCCVKQSALPSFFSIPSFPALLPLYLSQTEWVHPSAHRGSLWKCECLHPVAEQRSCCGLHSQGRHFLSRCL